MSTTSSSMSTTIQPQSPSDGIILPDSAPASDPPPDGFSEEHNGLSAPLNGEEAADYDIILIHGLNGNPRKTFSSKNNERRWIFWPQDLLVQSLKKCGCRCHIMLYGYDARTHSRDGQAISKKGLHGQAETLMDKITRAKIERGTQRRPIIFIAHSLGGLILKRALFSSYIRHKGHSERDKIHRNLYLSTHGIFFCGVPHFGAPLAAWGQRLIDLLGWRFHTSTDLIGYLRTDSEMSEENENNWRSIGSQFFTVFIVESRTTPLWREYSMLHALIVGHRSASMYGQTESNIQRFDKDHEGLVKFPSDKDDDYKWLLLHLTPECKEPSTRVEERWAEIDAAEGARVDDDTSSGSEEEYNNG